MLKAMTEEKYPLACWRDIDRKDWSGVLGPDVDLASLKLNPAIGKGEQGVVAAQAHVEAGVELGAALADDNGAGGHLLPPYALTPRYWALLSRPFFVLP